MSNLADALALAAAGFAVLPCDPDPVVDAATGEITKEVSKAPLGHLVPRGLKDATRGEATIRQWWAARPDALVGVVLGEAVGIAAFELDVREGRPSGVDTWRGLGLPLESHPCAVRTRGGGWHLPFVFSPALLTRQFPRLGADTRSNGSYVIAWAAEPWIEAAPLVKAGELPEVPAALLSAIKADAAARRATLAERAAQAVARAPSGRADMRASPDETAELLAYVASADRQARVEVGMALRDGLGDAGLPLWLDWLSHGWSDFAEAHARRRWFGFNGSGVRFATLAAMAAEAGADLTEIGRRHNGLPPARPSGAANGEGHDGPPPDDVPPADAYPDGAFPITGRRGGADTDDEPLDPWAGLHPPDLPEGIAPPVVDALAQRGAYLMGTTAGSIATAALAAVAGIAPDGYRLRVKRKDPTFVESARLWVALVGAVSARKSPALRLAGSHAQDINDRLAKQYEAALAAWDRATREERETMIEPQDRSFMLGNTTIEAAQDAMRSCPHGMLLSLDELAGFFGNLDRYNSNASGSSDRAFWLMCFNGGSYVVRRVKRGTFVIERASASIVGTIQPDTIARIAQGTVDDGLLQRFCPVILPPAELDRDEDYGGTLDAYNKVIEDVVGLRGASSANHPMTFDNDAQHIQRRLRERHHKLVALHETSVPKLAATIGKYDAIFARLCVIFHIIEHAGGAVPHTITADVAERAGRFLHEFLLPHALAFYLSTVGTAAVVEHAQAVGAVILRHFDRLMGARRGLISRREAARHSRAIKVLPKEDVERAFEHLHALGWLHSPELLRPGAPPVWGINPLVATRFAARAKVLRDEAEQTAALLRDLQGPES